MAKCLKEMTRVNITQGFIRLNKFRW